MVNFEFSQHLVNPQAIEVCQILNDAGRQAYIVGGCVRDLLLNVAPKDWDICTDADPQKVMELFPKNYPTGLQHGTVTVVTEVGDINHFEVTTFRTEGEYKDGRHPEKICFVMNVEQDLARRDLTINSIAYDPILKNMIDPFNGINDLKKHIIRAVGNPQARFQEDGLRIMRVARFAARFNYTIERETFEGMKDNLDVLKKVSKERIQDELCKTLMSNNPEYGLEILNDSGALEIICPALWGVPNNLYFLSFLNNCKGELETRLALMYSKCQPELAKKELLSLKFSNKILNRVMFLLSLFDEYRTMVKKDTVWAYKGFMAHIKNHSPDHWDHTLNQFIQLTEAIGIASQTSLSKYKQETVFSKKEMQLNGNDLISIGIKPGPQIKNILDACYLEILQFPEHNTKDFLLQFASK